MIEDCLQVLYLVVENININKVIWNMYFEDFLLKFIVFEDDGNYGFVFMCDVFCFQVLCFLQYFSLCRK